MKKFNKFLIPALALGLFAACSDDKMDNPATPEDNTNVDRVQYLNISISGDPALFGRAEGDTEEPIFDHGQGDEVEVNTIYLAFYDEAGALVTTIGPKEPKDFTTDNNPTNAVDKLMTATVEVEIQKGQNTPAYVMCYLNPIPVGAGSTEAALASKTIGDIKKITRQQPYKVTSDKKLLFGMSNSVYYDNNGELVRATKIPEGALKSKAEDIDDDTPTVDIYVERYAARVKVDYASATKSETTLENNNKYSFSYEVENWSLNAREQDFFVSKSFTKTADGNGVGPMGAENATYTDLTTSGSSLGNWWNDPTFFRSYWARSCAYFITDFPNISDDVTVDESTGKTTNFKLNYYSYNQIIAGSSNIQGKPLTSGSTIYAIENTIGPNALAQATNTLAALSSVVIVGKYTLKNNNEAYEGNPDFFVRDNNVYFDINYNNKKDGDLTIAEGLFGSINGGANQNTILYITTTDTEGKDVKKLVDGSESTLKDKFVIYHPFGEIENSVTIKIKDDLTDDQVKTLRLSYAKSGVETPIETVAELKEMNQLLRYNIGTMDAYKGGKAFFCIPIHHLGWTKNGTNPNATGTIDWTKVREGDFGIVRNHSYSIEISSIGDNLGSGIWDPSKPIVPEKTKSTFHGEYNIRMNAWKVVPKQTVKL